MDRHVLPMTINKKKDVDWIDELMKKNSGLEPMTMKKETKTSSINKPQQQSKEDRESVPVQRRFEQEGS